MQFLARLAVVGLLIYFFGDLLADLIPLFLFLVLLAVLIGLSGWKK